MSFLSVRRALLCTENDCGKQNSQKYSRSRIRLPSHLVLFIVRQDQDHPLLLEVDCSALLHVRDLAEVRYSHFHCLFLPILLNHVRTGF